MKTIVFENALGGVYGANEQGCFCGPKYRGPVQVIQEATSVSKEQLGAESVLISYDKIANVTVMDTTNHPVFVGAKGMADDIGVHAISAEDQRAFMEYMKASPAGLTMEKKRSSVMETAGKTLIYAIVSAVLTATYVWVADGIRSGVVIESTRGGKRGAQQRALIGMADALGPLGSLLVGGAITGLLIWILISKLKNRFPVYHLKP